MLIFLKYRDVDPLHCTGCQAAHFVVLPFKKKIVNCDGGQGSSIKNVVLSFLRMKKDLKMDIH
jgi:hypothetical protein